MRRSPVGIGLTLLVSVLCACSSKSGDGASSGAAGGAGGDPGYLFNAVPDGGGSGGSSTADAAGVGPNRCAPATDVNGCVGEMYVGETIPLDIYIMFDQSGSMLTPDQGGVTRIDAVRKAVGEFLTDPASTGLSVGIGYFGYEPIGQTTCSPADYEKADVPVGLLPDNAQAIIDSLAKRQPTGETPSGAAIRGACTYGSQWKKDHPGREVVLLMVTDGKPEAPVTCGNSGTGPCCPTLPDAVKAASDCRTGDPGLKTFVLGVGPLLDNLGQIAVAGGTDHAYLVSGGDVSQQVVDALNKIRSAAQIPCELHLPAPPAGQTLDPTRVNIVYTTSACDAQTIYYEDSVAACDAAKGGWYFDDPAAPQKVHLCPKTCDDVSIPGGQLMFSVGCARATPR